MRPLALLPLLIYRGEPRSALVIGLGTEITAGALLPSPTSTDVFVPNCSPPSLMPHLTSMETSTSAMARDRLEHEGLLAQWWPERRHGGECGTRR